MSPHRHAALVLATAAALVLPVAGPALAVDHAIGSERADRPADEDTTPPGVGFWTTPELLGLWAGDDVQVWMNAWDDGPGPLLIEYRLDDEDWSGYTGPVVISEEGLHTVRARATDAAGNVSMAYALDVGIDRTPPVLFAPWYRDGRLYVGVYDPGCGMAVLQYRVDGDTWWANDSGIIEGIVGPATVELRAFDAVGNHSDVIVFRVPGPAPDFVDVPEGHPFHAAIRWLAEAGISTGTVTEDGVMFRPGDAVSRQAMAAFVYRYAGADFVPGEGVQTFPDVPASHPFHVEIEWMAAQGLASGYSDGTFGPGNTVSRQAMASFLHRLAGEPASSGEVTFSDVPTDHRFAEAIAWLVESEVATGYPDNTFGPTNAISRQAMAAFLHRFDGL